MKYTNQILRRGCLILGLCILITAAAGMGIWFWRIHAGAQQAQAYVQTLQNLLPEPRGAVPEERSDNTMSVLSLDGKDFVGLLELPEYGCILPVCAQWGQISRYPCRLSGSIYDGTLQIGGTSQKGQYDFYRELSLGDTLLFTDMEGNRYTYTVTDLRYVEHADQTALQRDAGDLTLFIKNLYAFEYLILSCKAA